jgi:hypothetical protein
MGRSLTAVQCVILNESFSLKDYFQKHRRVHTRETHYTVVVQFVKNSLKLKVGKVGKVGRKGFIMPTWNQL